MDLLTVLIIAAVAALIGAGATFWLQRRFRARPSIVTTHSVVERIRAVGKLTGLEVSTKEITTQTKASWKWVPRLVLSPARMALIFNFERHYFVELSELGEESVRKRSPREWEITLPALRNEFIFRGIEAYDIQAGRLLGLAVDSLDAPTHNLLIEQAREESKKVFDRQDRAYRQQAMQVIAHQLRSLLAMFQIDVTVRFAGADSPEATGPMIGMGSESPTATALPASV